MTQTLYQRDFYSGIELRSVTDSPDYAPHFHDAYTIGLLTRGGQTICTGRKAETAFAGSVQFHEPFQVHENHRLSPNEFSFRHIEISKPRLLQLLNERMPPTRPNHIPDGDLFQSFMQVFDSLMKDDNLLAHDETLTAALTKLFPVADSSRFKPELTPRLVARIKDFLHANYMRPVMLDQLVELTGLSRVHISRTFKHRVGLAPHEYLVQLRVACAKARLAEGLPIAEAAALSGFTDQSHLTRHFKRITHLTPGAYAKSCYKRARR
jgi:AraC-like DNA-binding protein